MDCSDPNIIQAFIVVFTVPMGWFIRAGRNYLEVRCKHQVTADSHCRTVVQGESFIYAGISSFPLSSVGSGLHLEKNVGRGRQQRRHRRRRRKCKRQLIHTSRLRRRRRHTHTWDLCTEFKKKIEPKKKGKKGKKSFSCPIRITPYIPICAAIWWLLRRK